MILCGPHPDAGGGAAHGQHARRRGHRHQREPQPVSGQRHQDLRRRRLQAPRRDRGRDRAPDGKRRAARRATDGAGDRQGVDASTTPRGRYVVFAKTTFPRDLSLDGVRVVVDAAHGAAYRSRRSSSASSAPTVTAIGVQADGHEHQQGRRARSTPDNVRAEVVKRGAQIGIALDGDADRVIVIDEKGQIVDGDVVMAMCAARMLRRRAAAKKTLVATVMSNLGLERAMQSRGGKLVRTQVGDRYVVEAMRKGGYNLGGEQSGHLIFLDHASTGDGIVAALQVLAIMVRTGRPLSELAKEAMERVPQVLENVTLSARQPLEQMRNLSPRHGEGEGRARRRRPRARALERHRAKAAHHARGPGRGPPSPLGEGPRKRGKEGCALASAVAVPVEPGFIAHRGSSKQAVGPPRPPNRAHRDVVTGLYGDDGRIAPTFGASDEPLRKQMQAAASSARRARGTASKKGDAESIHERRARQRRRRGRTSLTGATEPSPGVTALGRGWRSAHRRGASDRCPAERGPPGRQRHPRPAPRDAPHGSSSTPTTPEYVASGCDTQPGVGVDRAARPFAAGPPGRPEGSPYARGQSASSPRAPGARASSTWTAARIFSCPLRFGEVLEAGIRSTRRTT